MITTMTWGGIRAGAGRRSAFPGNALKPFAMDFTAVGRQALDCICRRTKLSRNNVVAHLVTEYADALVFGAPGVVYPGKAQAVLAIRMPARQGDLLTVARARTGKSYSDIGEALVCCFGQSTIFPSLPERKRPKSCL